MGKYLWVTIYALLGIGIGMVLGMAMSAGIEGWIFGSIMAVAFFVVWPLIGVEIKREYFK